MTYLDRYEAMTAEEKAIEDAAQAKKFAAAIRRQEARRANDANRVAINNRRNGWSTK